MLFPCATRDRQGRAEAKCREAAVPRAQDLWRLGGGNAGEPKPGPEAAHPPAGGHPALEPGAERRAAPGVSGRLPPSAGVRDSKFSGQAAGIADLTVRRPVGEPFHKHTLVSHRTAFRMKCLGGTCDLVIRLLQTRARGKQKSGAPSQYPLQRVTLHMQLCDRHRLTLGLTECRGPTELASALNQRQ